MAASRLRITGGEARGTPLVEPRGMRLRPTSGLVREALFNILGDRVIDARVLDLYAGTGALGIEALSRGAAACTFVESDPAAVRAILESLGRAGFSAAGTVLRGRLPAALGTLEGPYDVALMDPPYAADGIPDVLLRLTPLLAPGGLIVYEHASRYNPPEPAAGLRLTDRRVYGRPRAT